MEGLAAPKNSSSRTTGKRPARAATRSRARAVHEPKRTARRHSGDASAIDSLYLSEMAESSILTAAQELEIGQRVTAAEATIFAALYRSPAGLAGLAALADDLAAGRTTVRELLLNPDQADLDLVAIAEQVRTSLEAARSHDRAVREHGAEVIAHARIDDQVLALLVDRVRLAASDRASAREVEALTEIELAERDIEREKARLVTGNLRLVVLFARKYLGRGVALLDLIQEGNLGLLRAADKFNHTRGFRFSTYAAWWIKQSLQRALLDRTVRLPVHVADDRRRLGKLRAAFVARNEREPTVEEICLLANLGRERVENILSLPAQPSSLDIPVGEDGDARLIDLVPSTVPPPDQEASLHALGTQMGELLEKLDEREQRILRLRFGLGQAREHTLEEVGKLLHLTRERIRQIEQGALTKLRSLATNQDLGSYLDD